VDCVQVFCETAVRAKVHNTQRTDTSKALVRIDDVSGRISVNTHWLELEIVHPELWLEIPQALVMVVVLHMPGGGDIWIGGEGSAATVPGSASGFASDIVSCNTAASDGKLSNQIWKPSRPSRAGQRNPLVVAPCFRHRLSTAASRTCLPLTAMCRGDVIVQVIGSAAGDSAHAAFDRLVGRVVVFANMIVEGGARGAWRAAQAAAAAAAAVFDRNVLDGAVHRSDVVAERLLRPKRPSAARTLERRQAGVLGECVAGHVRQPAHAAHGARVG
jgi:hypothetical protein